MQAVPGSGGLAELVLFLILLVLSIFTLPSAG